jgi:hypothetical protein
VFHWPALINNISTRGIALTMGLRHEPGTVVLLRARNSGQPSGCAREVQVVHVIRLPDGYWRTGCLFTRPLTVTELERLL